MIRIAIPALLALAACAPVDGGGAPPAPPSEPGDTYRALGTEPFWSLTIGDGEMRLETPDAAAISVPAPEPRTSFNGHRYETRRMTVDVTHAECSDGMSDRRYPDTVTVMIDKRTLKGCGGGALQPADLNGTNWALAAIDGEALPTGDRYFLRFRDGRIEGKAGCNGFGGGYSVDGDTLRPGPIVSTRMACPGPAMTHERKALAVLGGPATLSWDDGDTLTIRREGGELTLKRSY